MLIFKKEKEVRKLVLSHLDEVTECLLQTQTTLAEFSGAELQAATEGARKIVAIESTADRMEREIREVLLDGAFLPHVRSDVYRLVEAVDAVAGQAEDIATFLVDQSPRVPEQFRPDLLSLYGVSLDCFMELRKALKDYFKPKGKIESLHEHVNAVCQLETNVDNMESALARRIFSSDMELGEKIHLQQLVERIGAIADLSEDASDELEFAAMKLVV
jgi:predicted phosphate transport protein (TIGR00153 family)